MSILSMVIQVILGVGFLFFGFMKLSSKQMIDEFNRYRLPQWFRVVTGLVEIAGAAIMVAGIWNDKLAALGGLWLTVIMTGAILTHLRIKDPLSKLFMPMILVIFSLIVLFIHW